MKEIVIEVPDDFGKKLKPENVNIEIKGELIRCKDCKYRFDGCCYNYVMDDWFCADGRPKNPRNGNELED